MTKILNGPFKDMEYPHTKNLKHSTYESKIYGTYEKELEHVIIKLLNKRYDNIFNIGCAEGYYAVGFGRNDQHAKVYAYDLDAESRNSCLQTSQANNLKNIQISNNFDINEINNLDITSKNLMICDCEGCEINIFNESTINIFNLNKFDFLIEMHDFIIPNITELFTKMFLQFGYMVEKITSTSDEEKASIYNIEYCENLDYQTKLNYFKEGRPEIMNWLYIYKTIR
jgi:hypothetical protein